jgi:DNA-binding transcriptional MocR family regulator
VLLQLPELPARETRRLRAACRELGVGVYPATPYSARAPGHVELLLGYAALNATQISAGIEQLRKAIAAL